jgi:DNA replication and repair protein RecF
LDEVGRDAAEHYNKISGGQKLTTVYKPSVRIDDGTIERNFAEKLVRYKERERLLQTCLVGPHRDEVEFFIRGFPARSHGSQGEIRTAAVSLKLAVFDYLKAIRRVTPILLLDEIFAELDADRVGMLVELFGRFGQIFLTTASEIPLALAGDARKFRIENGTVVQE